MTPPALGNARSVAPGLDELPCGLATMAGDGTVLLANAALGQLVGRDASALVGQPFDALLGIASRVLYQSYLIPVLRLHGHLQEFALSLRAADGAAVDVLLFARRRDTADGPVYDLMLVPIRQRRQLEDEMLRVKRAADESPGMIFQLMCLPDGTAHFPYASEAVRTLYGCTPKAALDSAEAVFGQLLPDDRARLVRALADPADPTAPGATACGCAAVMAASFGTTGRPRPGAWPAGSRCGTVTRPTSPSAG